MKSFEHKIFKVANIVEDSRYAGPQHRIYSVAKSLLDSDIATVVYLPTGHSQFADDLAAANISVVQCPITTLQKAPIKLLKYFFLLPYEVIWLARHFKKNNIGAVHCSGGAWQIKGIIAGKLAKIPAIWHLNDTLMPTPIKMLFGLLCKLCATHIVVAGERVREYYGPQLQGMKNIRTIPAPVITSKFVKNNVENTKPNEIIRLVTVGHVNHFKGHLYLMECLKILESDQHEYQLLIIGARFESQKPYIDKLDNFLVENNLTNCVFNGPSDDVRELLSTSDIYVCSSIAEASPTSVWEAMSMSLPIVSTDVGDVSRYIHNDVSGYLVPVADPVAMAKMISKLASNPKNQKLFGERARAIAKEQLDIRVVAKLHYDLYKDISTQSKNPSKTT